jgi:hypothetical protein
MYFTEKARLFYMLNTTVLDRFEVVYRYLG